MRLLVAERDPALGVFLQRRFEDDQYSVDLAAEAGEAESLARQHRYDTAILDLEIPREDVLRVLRSVRARYEELPILILTGQTRPEDRAQALDLGADDLLLKPFAFSELSARVRALLRRGRGGDALLCVEDLELDRLKHLARRGGRNLELTPKEFGLLDYLMRRAGERVTRAEILEHVWNLRNDTMTNIVDVYINYLRKKIDAPFERKLIRTVRGAGYQLQGRARSAA